MLMIGNNSKNRFGNQHVIYGVSSQKLLKYVCLKAIKYLSFLIYDNLYNR